MQIEEFRQKLEEFTRIALVGPFAEKPPQKKLNFILFIDKGIQFRPFQEGTPYLAVGDGDSSSPQLMDILLPENKDVSDLGFALQQLPEKIKNIEMYGFFGGRLDHQLANLGEVYRHIERTNCSFEFDEGLTGHGLTAHQTHVLKVRQSFSVMTLKKGCLQINGDVAFALPQPTEVAAFSSHGLSNRGNGTVQIQCDVPFFVFFEAAHMSPSIKSD